MICPMPISLCTSTIETAVYENRTHGGVRGRELVAPSYSIRGTENVLAEYVLYAMAHNLGWLHSRIQNDKLDLHLYALKEEEKKAA